MARLNHCIELGKGGLGNASQLTLSDQLLENGTKLRILQELLSHSSPKTTQIYTAVPKTSLEAVKNYLNELL